MSDEVKKDPYGTVLGIALKMSPNKGVVVGIEAPASSTPSTTTPADYSALGKKGAAIQRAARQRRMTATERKAYRAGYQAQHMLIRRFLRAIEAVRQGLLRAEPQESR